MALRLYNTLSNQKEDFKEVVSGKVGIYVCGPTVYKDSHIGHAVGPVIFDALKKYLVHMGFEVTLVINITDVDDKLIIESKKLGVTMAALAKKVTDSYFECLTALGVDGVDHFPRATGHIPEIIAIIKTLENKDAAYAVEGDVYFDITRDDDYGKLTNRCSDDQETGTRDLSSKTKRNPADFALWKSAQADEIGWDSPWGRGRPGWHIECSAMSMKLLGETFDIHGGGIDLVFPHHENEIAQSETATGKPFANYWMHNGLTRMRTKAVSGEWKNEKMSKSLGNIKPIKALLETIPGDALRYFLLSTQYRTPIDFSEEAVTATLKGMHNIYRTLDRTERLAGQSVYASGQDAAIIDPASGDAAKALSETITRCEEKFFDCLEDDFNTAGALSELSVLSNAVNRFIEVENLETAGSDDAFINATNGAQQIAILGQVLGLFTKSLEAAAGGGDIDNVIGLLVDIRKTAKEIKNFSLSDAIRDGVISAGVTLEDRPDKTTGWQVNSREGTLNSLMTLVISLRQGVKDAKDFVMSDAIRDKGGAIGIVFEDRPDGTTGWRKQ